MSTATSTAPRQIRPVSLRKSETGSWLRTWSNGADVLVRDERTDRMVSNPAYLSANLHRTENTPRAWTVRLFVGTDVSVTENDFWTLRMARQALAYLATDWNPQSSDPDALRREAQAAVHAAWMEAADAEMPSF